MSTVSCQNQSETIVGFYKSAERNIFERGLHWLKGESWAVGTNLNLAKDSSFEMITCGNIITGNWDVSGDSLLLFWKTNRWRNDSLHEHGFEGRQPGVAEKPSTYLIDQGKLMRRFPANSAHPDRAMVEELEMVKP